MKAKKYRREILLKAHRYAKYQQDFLGVLAHRHRIQTLSHTHANSAGTTTTGLDGSYLGEYALVSEGADAALQGEDIVCWEDGKKLPVKDGFIILNRRLEEGDRVLLLRVQHGQKFIVLSRIFEEEA